MNYKITNNPTKEKMLEVVEANGWEEYDHELYLHSTCVTKLGAYNSLENVYRDILNEKLHDMHEAAKVIAKMSGVRVTTNGKGVK